MLTQFAVALSLAAAAAAASADKAPTCATQITAAAQGDPLARAAAQRGLEYLSKSAGQWTQQHNCYGCHVQAVTLEALTVGRHNHYDVGKRDVDAMVKALLLGVTAGGHRTGAAFQGAAWARYDQWVDGEQTAQLLRYARELMTFQQQDGSVADDDRRPPVVAGTMQTTFQAMQTWRQAYAHTADDAWLPPMRRAEAYLAASSTHWKAADNVYLQDINYALLGLVAAGAGSGEASAVRLQGLLLERQNRDGGWGLQPGASDPIATGQTLYALKLAGRSDGDRVIARGMAWLVRHQHEGGAWQESSSQGGADKGATMWGVLGLVTVDSISVVAKGITDGARVRGPMPISVQARDNQGRGVAKVELFVDDRLVKSACGNRLRFTWNAQSLSDGKHIVDAVATSTDGKQSRARYQVYAGNVFLTDIGARFDEAKQATEISLRDIGEEKGAHVALEILDEGGAKVFAVDQVSSPGAMTFTWDGKDAAGKPKPKGRYQARLRFQDAAGAVRQTESATFFHDSERVQRERFGEVEGKLNVGGEAAANTIVELVDDNGRVVQTARTTDQGNYRFKNIDKGQYKLRAKKEGFRQLEAPVAAAPAEAATKAQTMSW